MSVNGRKFLAIIQNVAPAFKELISKNYLCYREELSLDCSLRTFFSWSCWSFLNFLPFLFLTTPFYFLLVLIFKDFFFLNLTFIEFMAWNCSLPSIFLFDVFNSESFISSHMHRHGGGCLIKREPGLMAPLSFPLLLSGWGEK